ncbi:MAG: DPP IV N-terminal domain-containing protein, partial [Acidobacteriota bacterium]|nr:DPP IV N-terminal domain-containing protein [Acidobacteriota bacterium]
MRHHRVRLIAVVLVAALFWPLLLSAQGTRADYERAASLREKWQSLPVDLPERPSWIGKTHRFWYRKSVIGGFEFVLVDADKASKGPAFDHGKLAAALAVELKDKVDPQKLPFTRINFTDDEKGVKFEAGGFRWTYDPAAGTLAKDGPVEPRRPGNDGMGQGGPPAEAASAGFKASPDGKWEAFIRNYNVFVRAKDKAAKLEFAMSLEGSEGDYYTYRSLAWSPDSKKIAAVKVKPGYHRFVSYIESSPADQRQPKYSEIEYAKPGDVLDLDQPVLFLLEERRQIRVDGALFPNPYELTPPVWRKDSRAFTFEYNQRGHQIYRIIEVDGATGAARAVLSEEPKT